MQYNQTCDVCGRRTGSHCPNACKEWHLKISRKLTLIKDEYPDSCKRELQAEIDELRKRFCTKKALRLFSRSPEYLIYPNKRFEKALAKRFPARADIQDMARLSFYDGFEPQIDSYEDISEDELVQIRIFITDQHRKEQP